MKRIALPKVLLAEMQAHSRATYPEECCGFLIGAVAEAPGPTERTIVDTQRAGNEWDGERGRRFLIPPGELRTLERRLEGTDRAVVGFYHSHPDHPARPSQYDQDHAWPWYTYLVLSVTPTDVPAVGAFELDPDSAEFREVRLTLTEPTLTVPRG